jgi:hypothetical protein
VVTANSGGAVRGRIRRKEEFQMPPNHHDSPLLSAHESFLSSVTVLALLAANDGTTREMVHGISIKNPSMETSTLGIEFPLSPPVFGTVPTSLPWKSPEERRIWGGVAPDGFIECIEGVLFFENKRASRLTPAQNEDAYGQFLERYFPKKRKALLYAIPTRWWAPAQDSEWRVWLRGSNDRVMRLLMLWDEATIRSILTAIKFPSLNGVVRPPTI